jgi:competence protein ComEC
VLALAAIVLVAINPAYLVSDVSFQLSFIATLGLLLISPIYVKWLSKYLPRFISEVVGSTLAAETAVMPFIVYKMGIFSIISLPINVIILPFIPVLMLLGFILICLGFIIPSITPLIGYPAYLLTTAIIGLVFKASEVPYAAITFSTVPIILVSIFYLVIIFFIMNRNVDPVVARIER